MEGAGFDAVVGNPPYITIENLRATQPELARYLKESNSYATTKKRFDVYATFIEQGTRLTSNSRLSYIISSKFFESEGGEGLRRYLSENSLPAEIVDFEQYQIFDGATTYTCVLRLQTNIKMSTTGG